MRVWERMLGSPEKHQYLVEENGEPCHVQDSYYDRKQHGIAENQFGTPVVFLSQND